MNKALRQRLQTACAQHPKCTVAVLMHSVPGASETVCASVRCLRALVSAWFNMSSSICAAGVPQMTGIDQLIPALQALPALAQHACLLSSQPGWRQAAQQIHLPSQCLHRQSTPPG